MKRNTKIILRIVHGAIGLLAGVSACFVFAMKFDNIDAAVWAAVSGFVALLYVGVNSSVLRDIRGNIYPHRFLQYMVLAFILMMAGFAAMLTYMVIGINEKEGT